MVSTTTKTFKELYAERLSKYKHMEPAAALFYWGEGTTRGVRLEVPGIMKEFIDNVAFGRDPEGTLFFNHVEDIDGDAKYNVFYNTNVTSDEQAVVVQFFISTQDHFYAEFVGKDPSRAVQYTTDSHKGSWAVVDQASASAHVKKYSSESTITITIASIQKAVSFDVPDNSAEKSVDVHGSISFKKLANLKSDSVVNYNDDRILFYPETVSKDLTAVFIPVEATAADATALGDFSFRSSTPIAKWTDL